MRIGQVLDLTRTFPVTHQSLVFGGKSELAVNDGGGRKLIRKGTENMYNCTYIVLLDFVLNCGWMGDGGVAQVLNSPNYVVVQFNIYMAYLTIQSILFVHDFGEKTVSFPERPQSGPELRFWLRIGLDEYLENWILTKVRKRPSRQK